MLSLRVSRDKRGYDHIYLLLESRRKGRTVTRLLYGGRWPAPLRIGQPPLDEATRHRLEQAYPEVAFDWVTLQKTLQQALSTPRAAPPPVGRARRPGAGSSPVRESAPGPYSRSGGRGAPPRPATSERRAPQSPFRPGQDPLLDPALESVELDEPILASMAGLEQSGEATLEVVEETFVVHTASGQDDIRVEMDTVVVVAEIADDRERPGDDPDLLAAQAADGADVLDGPEEPEPPAGDIALSDDDAGWASAGSAESAEAADAGDAADIAETGDSADAADSADAGGPDSPAARRRRRRRRRGGRRPEGAGPEPHADAQDPRAGGAGSGEPPRSAAEPRSGADAPAREQWDAGADADAGRTFQGGHGPDRDDDSSV